MFSLLGVYVLGLDVAVSSGSIIDVFGRVGISEEAVRSTLARMVKRGLLARQREGRRVYIGLTDRASEILEDGHARIWQTGAVNRSWDGTWTVASFSLPDSRRSDRHELRSRLVWEGFGPLHNGQWIAAGRRDVDAIVAELGLADHVTVLSARSATPTTDADLVRRAFDTTEIALRYRAFVDRWGVDRPLPELPDDLARQLVLHTDWLQLVRQDPRGRDLPRPRRPLRRLRPRDRRVRPRHGAVARRVRSSSTQPGSATTARRSRRSVARSPPSSAASVPSSAALASSRPSPARSRPFSVAQITRERRSPGSGRRSTNPAATRSSTSATI
jgi:phenylacetic acid degradation operon negative regulatory protein